MTLSWGYRSLDKVRAERRAIVAAERERCAKIAEEVAAETGDGEGEIYIARKIADRIRALNTPHRAA